MTQETTPEVKGFGAMLREARESLGISIGDVSSRTRLSVDQIRAIEEENLERLPEPVYVRAFLRAYAKAIDIDYEPLVNDYVTRCGGGGVREAADSAKDTVRGRVPRGFAAGFLPCGEGGGRLRQELPLLRREIFRVAGKGRGTGVRAGHSGIFRVRFARGGVRLHCLRIPQPPARGARPL